VSFTPLILLGAACKMKFSVRAKDTQEKRKVKRELSACVEAVMESHSPVTERKEAIIHQ
jgi:hypothetical protein